MAHRRVAAWLVFGTALAALVVVQRVDGSETGAPPLRGTPAAATSPAAPTIQPDRYAGAAPLTVAASGANGVGLIDAPGLPCAQGGAGSAFHTDYEAPLTPGVFSALSGVFRTHLDVHSEGHGAPIATYSNAYLQGDASRAVLENERGTVRFALRSGSCTAPPLAFDGHTASGAATWTVESADGAYRRAIGGGTAAITRADVNPGADNPFTIGLSGSIDVLAPTLQVDVVKTYWGFLGVDYALRRATVVYRVTNVGSGDAFGVRLTAVSSPTAGVTVLGSVPQALGDLSSGESEEVRIVYQLGLLQPCLLIFSCNFATTLTVNLPDALDRPSSQTATVNAKAPLLPPPFPETLG